MRMLSTRLPAVLNPLRITSGFEKGGKFKPGIFDRIPNLTEEMADSHFKF